jgi:hypothetical protein
VSSLIFYSNYYTTFNYLLKVNHGYLLLDDYDSILKENNKEFSEIVDKNSDNRINIEEFCEWHIPSLEEIIKKQVNEIFKNCDFDENSLLDKDEIKKNVDIFKTFEFTNFGEDLMSKGTFQQKINEEF